LSLTEDGEQLLFEVREEAQIWMLSKLENLNERQLDSIIQGFESLREAFIL